MKFALYGMPCAGKTTLINALDSRIHIVNGSAWLNKYTDGNFSRLPENEKVEWRIKYTEYLAGITDEHIISDGHYAFEDTIVFTDADGDIYDVFFYLYCEPEELLARMQVSEKNQKFTNLTVDTISAWQNQEIEGLRLQCHKRNKDFYVIQSGKITESELVEFIDAILSGFSAYQLAIGLVDQIRRWIPHPCELNIVDGDKTFINEDSLQLCSHGFTTTVFDGNFYTGYQSYCFEKETSLLSFQYEELQNCTRNMQVWSRVCNERYVVLSSGLNSLWKRLGTQMNIPYVLASPLISADTKYYVAKILREFGYRVKAYGDSKIDLYLLREADEGYFCLGNRISRSLVDTDVSDLHLLCDPMLYILAEKGDNGIAQDIAICKSSSGIDGSRLAQAHFNLGYQLGCYMKGILPNKNIPVLVLERGGRFFGDGLYIGFGGKLYPHNPKKDVLPTFDSNLILIVDSVINTGESILRLVEKLRKNNPLVKVCLVTNVIQKDALSKLRDCILFAIRVSDNKFVGKRQKKQIGNSGPDTADRLFNLLDK